MRGLNAAFLLGTIAIAVACQHNGNGYGLERQLDAGGLSAKDARVYVALPAPGRYRQRIYSESGQQTRDAIVAAIQPRVAEVATGTLPEDHEAALTSARELGAEYAIVPIIEHWEDRVTEWTAKSDRVIIDIRVFDVSTGAVVDAAEVYATSGTTTVGGDHPQELLPRAVGDYVAVLLR